MGEQQQPDADRALLVDHFTKMYLEERAFVRHHEAQRGTATTILIGAGVTLIGVTVALWTALWKDGELQTAAFATIPLACLLILLGLGGQALSTKLFERSALNYHLSDAYAQSLRELLKPLAKPLFGPEAVTQLGYVAHALEPLKKWENRKGFLRVGRKLREMREVKFVEKCGGEQPSETTGPKVVAAEEHSPLDPREIVEPIHNERETFWGMHVARLDLYRIWR